MPAQSIERVQDAIHGLMEFRGLETAILDLMSTREMQRLRRVRQLGLAHLVFPAAEHSRFIHAVGASYLAIRFTRRLEDATSETLAPAVRPDPEVRRDMAMAALVHDVGHGPLSHAWEEVMKDFPREAWANALGLDEEPESQMKWHEMVTQAMLMREDGSLHEALESQEAGSSDRVARMLRGEYYLPYLPILLNGDVDVDRCDYVIRDAQMTGVAYGRYDIDWLISTANIGRTVDDKLVIGFDYAKAPRVIEQFLVARRALYDTVYQHKTVRAAEGMVSLFLKRMKDLVRDGVDVPHDEPFASFKKVFREEPLTCEELLDLDDFALWRLIMSAAEVVEDTTAKDLARRILNRDLLKLVAVDVSPTEFLDAPDYLRRVADAVRPHVPGRPSYYVYVDRPSFPVWSDDPGKRGYLVKGVATGLGEASPAKEHPELAVIDIGRLPDTRRLFVPKQAVGDVCALVSP